MRDQTVTPDEQHDACPERRPEASAEALRGERSAEPLAEARSTERSAWAVYGGRPINHSRPRARLSFSPGVPDLSLPFCRQLQRSQHAFLWSTLVPD